MWPHLQDDSVIKLNSVAGKDKWQVSMYIYDCFISQSVWTTIKIVFAILEIMASHVKLDCCLYYNNEMNRLHAMRHGSPVFPRQLATLRVGNWTRPK